MTIDVKEFNKIPPPDHARLDTLTVSARLLGIKLLEDIFDNATDPIVMMVCEHLTAILSGDETAPTPTSKTMNLGYPQPQLPWEFSISSVICNKYKRVFILTERNDAAPFVVHELLATGACHMGDYFHEKDKALECLYKRSQGTWGNG